MLSLIRATPGKTPAFYRGQSRLDPKAFARVIHNLKAGKKIKATGMGGAGTSYFAI